RRRLTWPGHLAAETEPAIDRTDMNELEQHPVGIAMDDAGDGRMHVVADRIGALAGPLHQLPGIRNELSRDRVVGIFRVDQRGNVRRYRHRIARGDGFESGKIIRRRKAVGDEFGGPPQCRNESWIDPVHASPAGGVHTTWSIRTAPPASMTRRSKPSATPLASGIWATASRKSSSSG